MKPQEVIEKLPRGPPTLTHYKYLNSLIVRDFCPFSYKSFFFFLYLQFFSEGELKVEENKLRMLSYKEVNMAQGKFMLGLHHHIFA